MFQNDYWALHFFVIISWNSVIFLWDYFVRLLPVRNTLENNLLSNTGPIMNVEYWRVRAAFSVNIIGIVR